jgi:hypothetical protein
VASQNEKTSLLGKTKQDYATILRWMSFANTEVLSPLGGWFRPILGRDPYNKKNVDESQKAALKAVHVIEEHLLTHTYLVGERLTLADIFAASILARGFQYFFDKQWRDDNPNTTRWYETIYNQSSYSAVAPKLEFISEAMKNVAPKKEGGEKEKKKEQPKAAPKPKKEEPEDDEEEAAPAPKAKHPLEALPKASFVLDDWKRKYSNEETREVALPWFWENANFEEYSVYKVDYKYNDELTLTFMTANLIGKYAPRSVSYLYTNMQKVVSLPVLRVAASTSSEPAPSTASPTPPSSRVLLLSADRRLSPLSRSPPTTRATSSPSSTPPRRRTVSLSTTSGRGTSPSPSTARLTSGPMVRCSSKRLASLVECLFSITMRMIYDLVWV